MTVSPFDAPATMYAEHSATLEDASASLFFPDGSGLAMDALTNRIGLYKTVLASLAESTGTIATTCDDQAHADRALATYPTPDDVKAAREEWDAAVAAGDAETAALLRPALDDICHERAKKVSAHADQCTATDTSLSDVVIDAQAGEGQPLHTPRSAGGNDGLDDVRELPGEVSPDDPFMSAPEADSSGTPSVADTDAGTSLSSDTGTASRTPSLYTGPAQPQMNPMHMQQGAPNAMGGGTPAFGGGVPSAAQNRGTPTSRTRGTQLNSTPVQRARDRKRDAENRSAEVPAPVVAGPVDRGSSNSGTVTKADTSGGAKTNLSASTASAPSTPPLSHLNGRGPIGPVGGGGPSMGSGSGVSGMKQRPEIYSTNPAQVGFDKDAIASGLLDRSTASTPEPDPVATGIPNADKVSR